MGSSIQTLSLDIIWGYIFHLVRTSIDPLAGDRADMVGDCE